MKPGLQTKRIRGPSHLFLTGDPYADVRPWLRAPVAPPPPALGVEGNDGGALSSPPAPSAGEACPADQASGAGGEPSPALPADPSPGRVEGLPVSPVEPQFRGPEKLGEAGASWGGAFGMLPVRV